MATKIVDSRFLPRYKPRYTPRFTPRFTPRLKKVFQSRWDSITARFRQLRELRRQQRGAYTPEELARRREILLEKSIKRHEKYAFEAKAHEEMLGRGIPALIPVGLLPKYKPRFRPVFRRVYRPNLGPTESLRVKYLSLIHI